MTKCAIVGPILASLLILAPIVAVMHQIYVQMEVTNTEIRSGLMEFEVHMVDTWKMITDLRLQSGKPSQFFSQLRTENAEKFNALLHRRTRFLQYPSAPHPLPQTIRHSEQRTAIRFEVPLYETVTCSCATKSICPSGPNGLPGPPGKHGLPGTDGPPGIPGADAKDLDETLIMVCPACPRGPRGPPGSNGKLGNQGVIGPLGNPGKRGPEGELGPPGDRGKQGSSGRQGPLGVTGEPGKNATYTLAGEMGPPGPPGEDGYKGLSGDHGKAGQRGGPGPPGESGNPGKQGLEGRRGNPGLQGANGTPGRDVGYCSCPARSRKVLREGERPGKIFTFKSPTEEKNTTQVELYF